MAGHRPRKRFGQHFLHDRNIIDKIAMAINPQTDDTVIEIGPGQGALTEALVNSGCNLHAIELDRDLIEGLSTRWPSLNVIHDDALKIDLSQLAAPRNPMKLVGNLPYNVSTPILFHALKHLPSIEKMVFMLQQEVVERMIAPPGSKTYGRLSVMLQYQCQLRKLFAVPPGAFNPPPKVNSAIVELTPKRTPSPLAQNELTLAAVVRAAFGQRRKTIANGLKSLASRELIAAAGIDPATRAEQLEVADFVTLANRIEDQV